MFNLFKKKETAAQQVSSFIGVVDIDQDINDLGPGKLYTITSNTAQALKYLAELYFVEHYDHYVAWCEFHNKDVAKSKEDYLLELNPDILNNKKIIEIYLPRDAICSILRMAYKCIPIECNFISDHEIEFYNSITHKNN